MYAKPPEPGLAETNRRSGATLDNVPRARVTRRIAQVNSADGALIDIDNGNRITVVQCCENSRPVDAEVDSEWCAWHEQAINDAQIGGRDDDNLIARRHTDVDLVAVLVEHGIETVRAQIQRECPSAGGVDE